jgi:RNA polymerase sigma-70 factor (ECF subfamily)
MMKQVSSKRFGITKEATVKHVAKASDKKELSLIADTAKGDEDAFEALYCLYYSRLFRFIYRITGRLDFVEDVINDVMYVVWEKAATYNQVCQLSSWIFGIAYNKSRNHKSFFTQVNHDSIEDVSENLLPGGDDWIERLETEDWLGNAFDVLSMEQRTVVELTYYHGMSYHEVAILMDCPENTIKTRMFHARKKLAAVL